MRCLPQYFSRTALVSPLPFGPLPAIGVCSCWRNIIMRRDVVRVLATNIPSGFPASIHTLLLRLDANAKTPQGTARYDFDRVRERMSSQGFPNLNEVLCGCPVRRADNRTPKWLGPAFDAFAPMLSSITGLTRLVISRCSVPARALHNADFCLGHMTHLRSLTLRGLGFGDDAFAILAACIGRLTQLTHLDLGDNRMHAQGFKHLVAHITTLTQLQSIQLQGIVSATRDLHRRHRRSLLDYIKGLRGLQHLELQGGLFNVVLLEEALQALSRCSTLRSLNLYLGSHGAKGAEVIFSNLASMSEIRDLQLLSFDHGQPTAAEQRDVLDIAAIPLRSLAVSDGACEAFLGVLAPRSAALIHLTALDLRAYWQERHRGAVAAALSGLSSLHVLKLTGVDLAHVLEPFASNATCLKALRSLDLSSSGLNSYNAGMLARVLQALTNLEALDLRHNSLRSAGMLKLAPALGALHRLQALLLSSNCIGVHGALALGPCLSKWTALTWLALDFKGANEREQGDMRLEGQGVSPDACMLVLIAHIANEERLAMLENGLSEKVRAAWQRLRLHRTGESCLTLVSLIWGMQRYSV